MFFIFFKDLTTSFIKSIFLKKIEKLINLFPQYNLEGFLFVCILYNLPSIFNKSLYNTLNLFLNNLNFI